MTTVTRTFKLPVEAPVSSTAPAWFTGLQSMRWLNIADNSGVSQTGGPRLFEAALQADYVWPTDLSDPLTPASPVLGPQGALLNSPSNYCQNSNGMAVDAVNGECFLVSNGGHGGYMGNETMRLRLRTATPGWERYIDSTPPWHISSIKSGTDSFDSPEEDIQGTFSYLCYTDGPAWSTDFTANPTYGFPNSAITRRPAATHTACLPTYSEGRVWLPLQNSTNLNGGTSSFSKLAVNIDSVRNNPALRQWKYGDIRPWEFYGVMTEQATLKPASSQSLFLFPTAALDESTGRIWICPGTSSAMRYFWMIETRGANAGRHQIFQNTGIFLRTDNCVSGAVTTGVVDTSGAPVKLFVLYGRRLKARDVFVLNITALEAQYPTIPYAGVLTTSTWAQYTATDATTMRWINSERAALGDDPSGTWGPQQAWGAVWHEGSKGLLMFNCDHAVGVDRVRNGNIRKLALPLNASGRYDPTQPWRYHDVTNLGAVPGTCGADNTLGTAGSFSRFNIMRNFDGAGNDLLVSVNAWNNATSVMKIPASGV